MHSRMHHTDPIDVYRLHDHFTVTEEPDDDVADANEFVGVEYGYGRPDLGEYELGEMRDAFEEFLDEFWPVGERVSDGDDGESERVCKEGEGQRDGNGDEGADGDEEQGVGGNGDGERECTNTDTATATAATVATEEEEVSTSSRYTNPDTFVAPTPANTPTQRH